MSTGFMNNGGPVAPPPPSSSSGPASQQAASVASIDQEMEGVQTISSPADTNSLMFASGDLMSSHPPIDPIMQQMQQSVNQYSIEHPIGNSMH